MSSGHSTGPGPTPAPSLFAHLELLEANERLFRALVEQSLAVTVHAADGALLYASPNAAALLGRPLAGLFGPEPGPDVHPEDWPALRRLFAEVASAGPGQAPRPLRFRLRRPSGAWLWIEATGSNRLAGPAIGAIVFHWREGPERSAAEERRPEGLGALAGGIAHNFNNLLTSVLGFSSLAQKDLPASSPVQPYLEHIERAAQRAAELCRQLLAYAGKGGHWPAPVSLSAVVAESADLLRRTVSDKAVLSFQLAGSLSPILADADQLRQMVLSLVTNASESLGDRPGNITVGTEAARFSPAADLPEGEYVVLKVSDTGCGMDEATRARIFEPFFSTKFFGRGLGLAAVLGMVRRHGGGVQVESAPGQGSTFRLLFPLPPATVTMAQEATK
jgi:PAS domain S-box-containing protein